MACFLLITWDASYFYFLTVFSLLTDTFHVPYFFKKYKQKSASRKIMNGGNMWKKTKNIIKRYCDFFFALAIMYFEISVQVWSKHWNIFRKKMFLTISCSQQENKDRLHFLSASKTQMDVQIWWRWKKTWQSESPEYDWNRHKNTVSSQNTSPGRQGGHMCSNVQFYHKWSTRADRRIDQCISAGAGWLHVFRAVLSVLSFPHCFSLFLSDTKIRSVTCCL